jgi:DNA modification methylase
MTTILTGDCIAAMKTLEEKTVQTCVTSPPYFGLRDYGHPGQIGLEPTPEDFVAAMVAVFREVRRVLRDDGTLWLNLGDSYARNPAKGGSGPNGKHDFIPSYGDARKKLAANAKVGSSDGAVGRADRPGTRAAADGLKEKDLIGIPWRVAFALQADGWYLRQDIIWHKPNPMPESVRDRCTKAHEYIFLLSKSPKYFFDNEAIKVPVKQDWGTRNRTNGKYHNEGTGLQPHSGLEKSYEKANKRSVWSVTTKPYKGAHFATFPPALIEPCILAGSKPGDIVLDPFGGSGTTGAVAIEHGRRSILIELNPEYIPLIQDRLEKAKPKLSPQPELFSL